MSDFVLWIAIGDEIADDVTFADLRRELLKELNLQPSEIARIFVDDDEESPDFFSDQDWGPGLLQAKSLPPPPSKVSAVSEDPLGDSATEDEADEDELAQDFTLEALLAATAARGLLVDRSTLAYIVAALRSGKHVVLTGPPGTGKTTLGEIVAELARDFPYV